MKKLLTAMLLCSTAPIAITSSGAPDCSIVDEFQDALVSGNELDLRRIVNRDSTLDPEAVSWLIGAEGVRPGNKSDLVSARQVLLNQEIRRRIVITDQEDGSTIIEVIYLPARTAESFVELSRLSKSGRAKNFRDYMMCEFVVSNGRAFMRNICFADTDVFSSD